MKMTWKRFALYAIILIILVAFRGHWLADQIGGRYLWSSCLQDIIAFAALVGFLKLADFGLTKLLETFASGKWVTAIRILVLLGVFFPFLLATLQIHPQRVSTKGTPADLQLPYEDVRFESRGKELHGWLLTQPEDMPRKIVLVAHGLNANRENFLESARILHRLGATVLIFDFPAHGDSDGRATTLGLLESEDVRAAHAWLKARFPAEPIHALGYSMGASAILTAQGKYRLFDRIAVDGTFASIRTVAENAVLRFAGPLSGPLWQCGRFWIRIWTGADLENHRPIDQLTNITPGKLLIIHGTADPVIPFGEGEALHEATNRRAQIRRVDGYGHAETIIHPEYQTWLGEFFFGEEEIGESQEEIARLTKEIAACEDGIAYSEVILCELENLQFEEDQLYDRAEDRLKDFGLEPVEAAFLWKHDPDSLTVSIRQANSSKHSKEIRDLLRIVYCRQWVPRCGFDDASHMRLDIIRSYNVLDDRRCLVDHKKATLNR